MSMQEFMDEWKKKDNKQYQNLLRKLMAKPKPEKGIEEVPTFQNFEENSIHQADLLYMPQDIKARYILVVVDVHSRKCDAEPLEDRTTLAVKNAFETIYKRTILELPRIMQVDAGTEFKGEVSLYFKENKVDVRVAEPNRHRSQGLVERFNQMIGTNLYKRMNLQELALKQTSKHWVKDLPDLINWMNTHISHKPLKKPVSAIPYSNKSNKDLLSLGTTVRTVADTPKNIVNNKKLHGKFRDTDLRWNKKERMIAQVLIKPSQPPMYLLDGDIGQFETSNVPYTRQQLQVVGDNEDLMDNKYHRKHKRNNQQD